jgi:hypothetical protein
MITVARGNDMSQQGAAATAPSLTTAEADRRKAILGLLKDALTARRISSELVGRRTIVLRSGRFADGFGEPARSADPQLYVFVADSPDIVTTDGRQYCLADGRTHPAADPAGAAGVVARRSWRPS